MAATLPPFKLNIPLVDETASDNRVVVAPTVELIVATPAAFTAKLCVFAVVPLTVPSIATSAPAPVAVSVGDPPRVTFSR